MPTEPELLDKHQTAKRLGVHWRTVLLFAKDGKLESASVRDPKTNQMTTKFPVEAVERLRKERAAPAVNIKPVERPEKPSKLTTLQRVPPRREVDAEALLTRVFERLVAEDPRPASDKPFLTFQEAVEYSGLPSRGLEELRQSGKLPYLDFGKGTRGGRYRFKRADLDGLEGERSEQRTAAADGNR
jgi:hypothetical protein